MQLLGMRKMSLLENLVPTEVKNYTLQVKEKGRYRSDNSPKRHQDSPSLVTRLPTLLGKARKTRGSADDLSRFVHVSSLTSIAFGTDASISARFLSATVRYFKNFLTKSVKLFSRKQSPFLQSI